MLSCDEGKVWPKIITANPQKLKSKTFAPYKFKSISRQHSENDPCWRSGRIVTYIDWTFFVGAKRKLSSFRIARYDRRGFRYFNSVFHCYRSYCCMWVLSIAFKIFLFTFPFFIPSLFYLFANICRWNRSFYPFLRTTTLLSAQPSYRKAIIGPQMRDRSTINYIHECFIASPFLTA